MDPLFEGLTSSEIEYLQYLQKRGYFDGFEMFLNLDTSSDYRVEKLKNGDYITMGDHGPHLGSKKVTITGKGVAALIDYEKYQNQIQPLNNEIEAINAIAKSLQQQVLLAEKSASDSERESRYSKRMATLSLIVAILSIIPSVISLLTFF